MPVQTCNRVDLALKQLEAAITLVLERPGRKSIYPASNGRRTSRRFGGRTPLCAPST